jgi:hypothetical protein
MKTGKSTTAPKRPATKGSTSSLAWDYSDDLVPRVGLPAAESIERRQRRIRRYVKWSATLMPFVLLLSILAVLSTFTRSTPTSNNNASASSSRGRTVATLALDQWLTEVPSPLPGVTATQWDGATLVAPSPVGPNSSPTWNAELDSFTLYVGTTIYNATIEVALRPGGGAVTVSGPSLTLVPPTDTTSGWNSGGPWSGLVSSSSVSSSVQSALDGWLSAYVSGSSSRLRLAVGDTSADGTYVSLAGVKSATMNVVAGATRVAPNAVTTQSSTNPSAEIIEINLYLIWNHQKVNPNQSIPNGPATTLDLLVERADTAAPVVVAWGAPGTGPSLVPYQNVRNY